MAILTLGPRAGIKNNVVTATVDGERGCRQPSPPRPSSPVILPRQQERRDPRQQRCPRPWRHPAAAEHRESEFDQIRTALPLNNPFTKFRASLLMARPRSVETAARPRVRVRGRTGGTKHPPCLSSCFPWIRQAASWSMKTSGATLALEEYPGFSLTAAPNSAIFPTGQGAGRSRSPRRHPDKIPMVPNFCQQPRFIVTIQPPGVRSMPRPGWRPQRGRLRARRWE